MQRFVEEMAAQNAKSLKIRVRAPSFFAIAEMAAQGAGIAVLPEAAARHHAVEMPAMVVMLDDLWATRELRLCVRSLDKLSVQARQLLAYLTDSVRS